MADTTPPTIAITSSKTKLKAGETTFITFTLSEPATDFVVSDLVFTGGGTLTGFSGSGSNYSAVFTPPTTGEGSSVVSVGNFKFSDAAGNANEDGADANNRLELTYDTISPTITITSNKNHLGPGENAAITFSLSEPSTDFTIKDITTTYGTLTGFSGSGKSYTATFVPSGVDVGLITVNGYRFSDSFGNQNDQGTQLVITPFDPSRDNVQWVRHLGTSSWDSAKALTTGSDGAIYMAGYTRGSLDGQANSGNYDAFLAKFVLPDNAIPTIALQADKTSVTAGGSVGITFTLSKPSTNFIAPDVTVVNGVLSNFSGSGTTYTATFTPSVGSTTASLSVGSGKFSDALGNFNEDGAETNNTVTITRDLNTTRTHSVTVLVNKGVLGSTPVFLKDLVEEITTTGTTVTSHTVTYQGTKFKYSDIDALITTVIRDGEFTDEFRKELTDAYPSYGGITYKEAISLVGAANVDSILMSVAGADGNYVG